jgi:ADP-ribose pyrophosphatase YjhB (NUDIX family)
MAGDRRYPSHPWIGVGAILLRRDRVLLARRAKDPLRGWWSLPGGALETGETLADGVRREVLEETGLEVDPYAVFEIFERITRDASGAAEYHYVLVDYLCRATGGVLAAGDDVSEVAWVRPRRAASLRPATTSPKWRGCGGATSPRFRSPKERSR